MTVRTVESDIFLKDLTSPHPTIYFKKDGEETTANTLVTELMIAANEAVGKIGKLNNLF